MTERPVRMEQGPMKPVLCFGEALIDFLPLPTAPGAPRAFQQNAGGAPANVAVAMARLGGRAEFVGALGADMFGDFLHGALQAAGVGTAYVQRTAEAPTALAFVALDDAGERSFSFYRPPAADLLFREAGLPVDAFAGAGGVHVCSNSLTEAGIASVTLSCLRRARAAGVLVSVDMNLRPALWPAQVDPLPRIRCALALADVVKLSAEELRFLAGTSGHDDAVRLLLDGGAALVVITDGGRPLHWHTARDTGCLQPFAVDAVDSTAAGDAFTGGLLFALARHGIDPVALRAFVDDRDALSAALRFAAACGAVAVTRRGAFAAMPSLADVETLMRGDAAPSPERP